MGHLEDLDVLVTNGRLEDLETQFTDANADKSLMPALVADLQQLMRDPDPRIRTAAASIAFTAVRGLFSSRTPAERVALCAAVSIDLEAAFEAGLVEGAAKYSPMHIGRARANWLRGVLRDVRERRGEIY
jgi:hypothetical protein